MDFQELAPLLSKWWPHIVTFSGVCVFLNYVAAHRKEDQADSKSRGGVITPTPGRNLQPTGKPDDEDDHVFQDVAREDGDVFFDDVENVEHVPFSLGRLKESEMLKQSWDFYKKMNTRRTVRHFSPDPVPREVIENVIRTAGWLLLYAPSL